MGEGVGVDCHAGERFGGPIGFHGAVVWRFWVGV